MSNRKREKKAADRKKGVKQQKHIQKKSFKMPTRVGSRCSRLGRRLRARRRRSRRGSSLLCSLLPFMPWVVAAGSCVQRVTCGCCRGWLQGPHLGSEVALCVGAWRGRGLLLQLHSESLEGSCFSLSYRVGLGRVSPTPTANKKKKISAIFRHGTVIFNPPRHRYLVAFFKKSATQLHHGTAMAAI